MSIPLVYGNLQISFYQLTKFKCSITLFAVTELGTGLKEECVLTYGRCFVVSKLIWYIVADNKNTINAPNKMN